MLDRLKRRHRREKSAKSPIKRRPHRRSGPAAQNLLVHDIGGSTWASPNRPRKSGFVPDQATTLVKPGLQAFHATGPTRRGRDPNTTRTEPPARSAPDHLLLGCSLTRPTAFFQQREIRHAGLRYTPGSHRAPPAGQFKLARRARSSAAPRRRWLGHNYIGTEAPALLFTRTRGQDGPFRRRQSRGADLITTLASLTGANAAGGATDTGAAGRRATPRGAACAIMRIPHREPRRHRCAG